MTAFDIATIETPGLGDRSYLVTDGTVAAVVDPQRDIDRVLEIVDRSGLDITHVLETHIHNDYVTGGLELARERNAAYVVAGDEPVAYERSPMAGGDELSTGDLTLRALHTPGHTPHHLSYVALHGGRARAVFTGGSMLFGSVGRTDLLGHNSTDQLTRAQWRSVRRLAAELDPSVEVCPTHGFGSFCSSSAPSAPGAGNIADQRGSNLALVIDDEDDFVAHLLSGLTAYPRYYAHMGPLNRAGPQPLDLTLPAELTPDDISQRLDAGHWVVDVRRRRDFAELHLAGTVGVELGDSFATYLGWVLPWGWPIVLVGDSAAHLHHAQRALSRIGIDRLEVAAGGVGAYGRAGARSSYRAVDFAEVAAELRRREVVLLDVRRDDEWNEARIEGALHIPLPDLEPRVREVPDAEVWVYCSGGFRASIAASLLDRAGVNVVLIDDAFDRAAAAGLPVVN